MWYTRLTQSLTQYFIGYFPLAVLKDMLNVSFTLVVLLRPLLIPALILLLIVLLIPLLLLFWLLLLVALVIKISVFPCSLLCCLEFVFPRANFFVSAMLLLFLVGLWSTHGDAAVALTSVLLLTLLSCPSTMMNLSGCMDIDACVDVCTIFVLICIF